MAINRLPIKLNQWVKRNGPIEKFIFINLKKEMNTKIAVNVNRKITNQISGIHCFFKDKNSPYSEIIYWLILIKNYFDFFKNTQILRNSNNVVRFPLSLAKSPFVGITTAKISYNTPYNIILSLKIERRCIFEKDNKRYGSP